MAFSLAAENLTYDDVAENMNIGEAGAVMFGLPAPEYRQVSSNLAGENTSERNLQSLKGVWKMTDNLTLTSITANTDYKQRSLSDFDYSPMTLMHTRIHSDYQTLSQEFRLSRDGKGLCWLAGIYGDDTEQNIRSDTESFMGTERSRRDITGNTLAAFEIVNAKVGYETEHFDIYVYGKNIFDTSYDSFGYYGGFYTIYSEPGEYGIQAVFRF